MRTQKNAGDQAERKLLQEEVHKELENKIIELLRRAEIRDLDIVYQFALRVIS